MSIDTFCQKNTAFALLCFIFFLLSVSGAISKTYQVTDRVVSVLGSEGKSKPVGKGIASLQDLIHGDLLKAGDVIQLETGDYKALAISSRNNKGMISIIAGQGQTPRFSSISIKASQNWTLRGLEVSLSHSGDYKKFGTLITIADGSKSIVIENSRLFSVADISKWSGGNWKVLASDGIVVRNASHIIIRKNLISNINHGIYVDAGNSLVEKNVINNFSGKAISGHGNFSTYQYNTIRNCYRGGRGKVGGLIFWLKPAASKKELSISEGNVLRGNKIINSDKSNTRKLCELVGIRLYGGIFNKWVIENNLVIPTHWSGISVNGARNTVVSHNTVFNPYMGGSNAAQISVRQHKNDKEQSDGNVVINNISQGFSGAKTGIIWSGNLKVKDGDNYFRDYQKLDFRLKRGSRAINAAVTARYFAFLTKIPFPGAPEKDVEGTLRPQGKGRDIGAYERLEKQE